MTLSIKPGGFWEKFGYGWLKDVISHDVPREVPIGRFLGRVFASIIVWTVIISTRLFGWAVRIVGAPAAFILFAYRPAGPSWRMTDDPGSLPFVPIEHWPKWGEGQYHVMPIIVASFAMIAAVGIYALYFIGAQVLRLTQFFVGQAWHLVSNHVPAAFLIFLLICGISHSAYELFSQKWRKLKTQVDVGQK